MKRRIFLGFLMGILVGVSPFLTGYMDGLAILSTTWTGTLPGTKDIIVNLSGSQQHSLLWSFDEGGLIAVQVGVRAETGTIWVTPTGVGPFTITTSTPQIEPLFLPVSEKIKFVVTGTGTGTLAFIGS